jgi:choline dehydrogenase
MQGPHIYRASPLADPKAAAPQVLQLKANRDVILSAGTFNSPQILKLSGIGATSELSQFGIKTEVELPAVGLGMMDRYETSVVTQLSTPFNLFNSCAPQSASDPCFAQYLSGSGPYATNLTAAGGLIKSNLFRPERDLLLMLAPGPFRGYYPGWQNEVVNPTQFSWLILKAHTQNSAGTVMLRSNDPRDTPLINMHYFDEGNDMTGTDMAGIANGLQLARQLNHRLGLSLSDELFPGPSVRSMVDLQNYAKNTAWGHHAACSNRMGKSTDDSAVVDSNFKVIGTSNLRVVDASVFPRIPGFYPMVAIQMLSEKASDTILAGR